MAQDRRLEINKIRLKSFIDRTILVLFTTISRLADLEAVTACEAPSS